MEPNLAIQTTPETILIANNARNTIQQKRRKVLRRFSLFDFIVETKRSNSFSFKKVQATRSKNHSTIHSNRIGKRKKSNSRLRKRILLNRKIKQNKPSTVDDEIIKQIASLKIADQPTTIIHSRRFRSYCDNTTSPKLLDLTEKLLREIFRFQARAFEKNQIKGRAHKRYVLGFKECLRQLVVNKVKLMIIAPDCETCSISGGIDETISNLIRKCLDSKVPYMFALERRKLGYVLFKNAPVSCVAVTNYDGAQTLYQDLLKCLETEKLNYREICNRSS